ncbi:MAG: UvrD/REP helicase [Candidatus Nomurabacteria bacterium GW2011_GWB1_37_5]|uniref:DNA 3'-5' helicase n=1 Tax=Candidatus Nomurabacteria bacterium GW2011_GWB1_37_5 TaxID=1618742 RepID=A0A0G0JG04_9BACT|nr:MAG: UvrD/REP helicase [Candidatus Nomurabacteria bacterium GW2011_GWB1_37_5]
MDHLSGLNPAQREAVLHKDGPVLIVAGAGAGKTKTIVHRIANLIKEGVRPENILAITFTNKAAKEMRDRTHQLLSSSGADFARRGVSQADETDNQSSKNKKSEDEMLPRKASEGATGAGGRKFSAENFRAFRGNISSEPYISTFHALCAHILRENAREIGMTKYFKISDQEDSLSLIKAAVKENDLDPKQYSPRYFQSIISKMKGEAITLDEFKNMELNYMENLAQEVWEKYEASLAKEKALDFDDLLLKTVLLFRKNAELLKSYQNRFKYLHIDEYQDTNKVQYELSQLLARDHKNICVVGDNDQCLISGTNVTMADGTYKKMETLKKGEFVLSNYGCGDFRPARILSAHKRAKKGELIRITTLKGKILTSTPEHIHFAGYRLGTTPQLYFTYLMHKKGTGWRIGTTQVYTKSQKQPIIGLALRNNQEHADSSWVIAVHKTPNEARILEYNLSLKYRIPTIPFTARKGLSLNGYVHDQVTINKIFSSFNTEQSAKELLFSYGLSQEHPHHHAKSNNSNRRNLNITLCADRRGKTPMHLISMSGNDDMGSRVLKSLGLSVRPAKKRSSSWCFETVNANYGELLTIAQKIILALPETHIVSRARLGGEKKNPKDGNSLPCIPAGSIMPGMALFTDKGDYDVVEKIERVSTKGRNVYDLNIEKTHNFIANGLITHNCIYSWRGADIRNILSFEKDYPGAKVVMLEENYRSTQNILNAANEIIKKNVQRVDKNLFTNKGEGDKISLYEAMDEKDEADFVATKILELKDKGIDWRKIAVLYRANYQSRVLEESMITYSIPYQVIGVKFYQRKEIKDILAYLGASLNPENLSDIKRIINFPPRGIGKVSLLKIFAGRKNELSANTQITLVRFYNTLEKIKEYAATHNTSETIKFLLAESGIEKFLKDGSEDDLERLENLRELVSLAKKYDNFSGLDGITKLLEDAALMSDQDTDKEEKDGVRLMTVHAAKGLEFSYVFIVGLEQGLFPHQSIKDDEIKDPEEERRLFYVALTRAEKKIFLTYASMRTIFGSRDYTMPSEFLSDIPENLIELEPQNLLKTAYY